MPLPQGWSPPGHCAGRGLPPPPPLKELVLHWTHPPNEALLTAPGQFLVVIYRGNPKSSGTKLSMCKNTSINASGYFWPEKLKFLKPMESQVSTVTGRGFHGQLSWMQLPEPCFKGYQSPRFFTGSSRKYWNKITAGIYSVSWIQSILKILFFVIKYTYKTHMNKGKDITTWDFWVTNNTCYLKCRGVATEEKLLILLGQSNCTGVWFAWGKGRKKKRNYFISLFAALFCLLFRKNSFFYYF